MTLSIPHYCLGYHDNHVDDGVAYTHMCPKLVENILMHLSLCAYSNYPNYTTLQLQNHQPQLYSQHSMACKGLLSPHAKSYIRDC